MSFFSDFFSGKKAQYDPYGDLNPEQKQIVQTLGPNLNTWANTPASSYQYTGDFTAPLTPEEQTTQNQVARLGAVSEGGFNKLMSGWSPEWEQIYKDSMYDPEMKVWQEQTQPALEESYAGPGGYWGTARAGAVQRGLTDLQSDLRAKKASLMKDVNFAPIQAGPAMASTYKGISDIQAVPRLIKQYGLDQKYADYVRSYDRQQQYINNALSFLGLKTGTYTPAQKSGFSQLLPELIKMGALAALTGGAGLGAGAAGASTAEAITPEFLTDLV